MSANEKKSPKRIESLEPMILMSASAAEVNVDTLGDGTDGNDVLIALSPEQLLEGKGGHDIMIGLAGNNVMKGGDGHDMLIAVRGDNVIDGGAGQDTLMYWTMNRAEVTVVDKGFGILEISSEHCTDFVTNVESIRFKDGDFTVAELLDEAPSQPEPEADPDDVEDVDSPVPGPVEGRTIAEIAAGNPEFSILVGALEATGLTSALDDMTADLTVFAPTNAAFEALATDLGYTGDVTDSDAVLGFLATSLNNVGDTALRDVLLYHVVSGAQTDAELDGRTIETLSGETISVAGNSLVDAEDDLADPDIVVPNAEASNGIVHIIDRVLIPLDLIGDADPMPAPWTPPPSDNLDPIAVKDKFYGEENQPVYGNVAVNDSDPDGPQFELTYELKSQPNVGRVNLYSDGSFDYQPPYGFTGDVTFEYTVRDADGGEAHAEVCIHIEDGKPVEPEPENKVPVANPDSFTTNFETSVNGSVIGNDTEGDRPATISLKEGPANGTVQLQSNGDFVYTPNAGFSGTDTFQYKITDADGDMDMTTVTIDVADRPNLVPNAVDDAFTTDFETPITASFLDNDSPGDGENAILLKEGPSNGIVELRDGQFIYTPDGGFSGVDSFQYTITDADGDMDMATVSIKVEAPLLGSIEGKLFRDGNKDGQSIGDGGIADRAVTLVDQNGSVVATTATNANGDYSFGDLVAGVYQVHFAELEDNDIYPTYNSRAFDFTLQNIGNDATDSDVFGDGKTDFIAVQAGQHVGNVDAGEVFFEGTTPFAPGEQDQGIGVVTFGGGLQPFFDYGQPVPNFGAGLTGLNGAGNGAFIAAPTAPSQEVLNQVHPGPEPAPAPAPVQNNDATGGGNRANFGFNTTINNNGDGTFGFAISGPTGSFVVSPMALDLNGDSEIGVTGQHTARDAVRTEIGETVEFDIDADGALDTIEWFAGDGDGILVDTTEIGPNNEIDGSALFGDQGGQYDNGYDKLALLDANGDGVVSGREASDLAVWIDDGDAKLEDGELVSLGDVGVASISTQMELDAEGRMRSTAEMADGSEMLTEDVWFASK